MKAIFLLIPVITLAFTPSISLSQSDPPWRSDALVLACETGYELIPDPGRVEHINANLEAMRALVPQCTGVHVNPSFYPGYLNVQLTYEAFDQYLLGKYHGLDAVNELYGPVDISYAYATTLKLVFDQPYNSPRLVGYYENCEGVEQAYPCCIHTDGPDIWIDYGYYFFRQAWGWDCPSGCKYEHFWVFDTRGGIALVGEWGSPLAVEPTTWGTIKSKYSSPSR